MALGYVRAARPEEAGEIARLQVTTWRTAYRRLLPTPVLDGLDQAWMAARWQAAIERPPTPRHRVLLAVEQAEQDHLVGFAASGPADQDAAAAPDAAPPPEGTAAITDLLVEPRWGRRGHGSRLLAASVDLWRGDSFTRAVAWVLEADPATRAFLASAGWEPDGARRALDVDDLLVPQLRMHTILPDA
jgi:GNAT superfamily N-acetyltransferase